ncbi:hypothetical protein V6N13_003415 [Hibiscus sabdariffa]|uniref:Uncharacterized protein n=1 Tax=Hibiscus sabdariffa TaxID=183260 RepID=A0ABR2NJQ7_9ROSI
MAAEWEEVLETDGEGEGHRLVEASEEDKDDVEEVDDDEVDKKWDFRWRGAMAFSESKGNNRGLRGLDAAVSLRSVWSLL